MQIRRRPPNPDIAVMSLRNQIADADAQPSNILEEIIWYKEAEVDQMREKQSLQDLQRQVKNVPPSKDFLAALTFPGAAFAAFCASDASLIVS